MHHYYKIFSFFILMIYLNSCESIEKKSIKSQDSYFSITSFLDSLTQKMDSNKVSIKIVNNEKLDFSNKIVKQEILKLSDADINKRDWLGNYSIDTIDTEKYKKIVYQSLKKNMRIQQQIVYLNPLSSEPVLVYSHFYFKNFLYELDKKYIVSQDEIILETTQKNIMGDSSALKIKYKEFI